MRKKFAKRWRREAIRRGAIIVREGPILTKQELAENHLAKRHRGFSFVAKYRGWEHHVVGQDALDAYRIFVQELDDKEFMDELGDRE